MDEDASLTSANSGIFGDSSTDFRNASTGVGSVEINFARGESIASGGSSVDGLARPVSTGELTAGTVLAANPLNSAAFWWSIRHARVPNYQVWSHLPPPAELGPDRRADLLPVLVLVT
jgi:hypothetical protein